MATNAKASVLLIQNDPATSSQIICWLDDIAQIKHISSCDKSEIEAAIQEHSWDLVITNVHSNEINDVTVNKMVKLLDPTIPVIIVTQHQRVNFILEALEGHADSLQFKPLDKNKFVQTTKQLINECIDKRRLNKNVILAISAHPDDVEIGCGGTLARHQALGDRIHLLTLSHGEMGGDPYIRKEESKLAASVFSAHLHMNRLEDTNIPDGIETIHIIEEVVNTINPTHVYTHSEHDIHKDHRSVHFATITACRKIRNLFCYQSPSSSTSFQPSLFIELTEEYMQKKLEAIACYQSQCTIRPYLQPDFIRASARYWGRFNNFTLSEPMEIVRQKILLSTE